MSDTTHQTGRPVAEDQRVPGLDPTRSAGSRGDVRGKPLAELAVQLTPRGCRATLYGDTLAVAFGARTERVIACDGVWFRWGGENGTALGRISDVGAAADAAVTVLKRVARWS